MRKIISIRIDPNVWKAAREKGLNISQICEQALKFAVLQKGGGGTVGSPLEPRAGFEPATSALPRRCPDRLGHRGGCGLMFLIIMKNVVGI